MPSLKKDNTMENNVIRFKCPHCQLPLAFRKPENGFGVSITCPRCNNAVRIKIREKTIHLPEQGMEPAKVAHLLIIDGPQADHRDYPLHQGGNIIGRDDPDTIQDIAIGGDITISRRSANIEVGLIDGRGYSYLLKVLSAKNPVYVNGSPLYTGDGISLRTGDIIQFGSTKLMLK